MTRSIHQGALVVWLAATATLAASEPPLRPHPSNPRYLRFRGRPVILLTSGEHYGAVLNRDFDYLPYLDELKNRGFNLTRTFSGTYREVPGSFGITENTLAPAPGRFVCPWARSETPGAADGDHKYDLNRFDPAYFKRLRDFVAQAGKRGIVVEIVLFCAVYDDKLWAVNPMHPANNVNDVGKLSRKEVYTLRSQALSAAQETLVRKIVTELKDFDNVYYEVCNEPYFGDVTRAWNDRMVAAIVEAERGLAFRHLIAQNIANGSKKIDNPNPDVGLFNFHYATPPNALALNAALNRALGDDETGFKGTGDLPYRTEGWEFILTGGAVYSNLDYSFTVARPDGTARVTTSPGGGGPALRTQLKILKDFIHGFDFVKMKPDNTVLKGGVPAGATARALVESGKAYAVYLRGGSQANLVVEMPAGAYRAEWIDTKSGAVARIEAFRHAGGNRTLASPPYVEDIALRVVSAPAP
jgi:hypothetical protein